MKCPQCGQWNRASWPVCSRCGAALTPEKDGTPAWKKEVRDDQHGSRYYRMDEHGETDAESDARDVLAEEMAELKLRKAEGIQRQRRLRRESAERGSAPSGLGIRTSSEADRFWNVNDDPLANVRVRKVGTPQRENGSRTAVYRPGSEPEQEDLEASWDTSRNWDPLWAEQQAYGTRMQPVPQTKEIAAILPSRHRALRRFFRLLALALSTAVLALCVFFGYHYFQDRRNAQREANAATVVASMLNDLAAHTIMIPGEDGQQIYIRELYNSYVVSGGFATIEVADHTWYDNIEELIDPTIDVTLTPFLKTSSGRQQPLDPITFSIDIPISPIILVTPDGARQEVASAMYTMQFEVRAGSKVYINDVDVSDTINSDTGILSCNVTVQPIGDNIFTLRCRSQYCRENRMTIVLYREVQDIPLDLAADTYTSTSLKHMEVNCTTLPGATIDITSPYSDLDITNLNSTGAFSFIANFDHIGDNVIEINASYPGKKTSHIEYTVYYLPPATEYTTKAWPLHAEGYAELVSNINYRAEHSQIYVVMGTLQYFVSEKPQLAVFNTSEDGLSQPVLVENFTKTKWEQGVWYCIYADAYGTYTSMPRLCGRYTYLH